MQSAQQDDSTGYAVREGLLWFNGKVVVPPDSALQRLILTEFHNTPVGGHAGMQRTLSRIASMFYWPKCGNWFEILWQGVKSVKLSNHSTKHHRDYFSHFQSRQAHFAVLPGAFNAPMVAALFIKEIVRLHGFPTTIISDRYPVFMSSFWQELFKLQGTTLATSSAYHPQTDGQTEVLNRCLEDYLRCFVADHPKQWLHYLSWAEWHYNTAYHSTIKMTPFEAVYGRPPPSLLDYLGDSASIDVVDALLKDRTQILSTLKDSLLRAQTRMRNQTNTHRTDVTFQVDDWVFLKLKPYRQTTVAHRQSQKLSKRFFGPFRIITKIDAVAYKLALPEDARIHNVFHVSNLKKCRGDPLEQPQIPLPARFKDSNPILQPAHVLGFRQISQLGKLCPQLLIQWEGQDPSDATWENTHEF
ncbi:Transposon Ty3-G Gag-Pol polyprotein [Vitis vinifera]|uniref:Transposon Ty3-G Gag-Pol polyprotein n=1 Tax=Vitis vinifera TaxID=29760 RepID=A0A438CUR1_VITVI|nr:Transposon Ty3-G Gag-Pol polyprotein [Vitis vinifera]